MPLRGLTAEKSGFGDNLQVVPEFQDPAGGRNYYYFRAYRNGVLDKTLYVQDDEFTDGKANTRGLRVRTGDEDADRLAVGDSVRVDMQNVDADAYQYLRTLSQILAGNPLASASPANPKSNFSGNVLGYFSAHTLRRRSLVVPPL